MNDNWKIFCLILRQLFIDWPVAILDRMTFRKVLIIIALLAITIALLKMGVPDASLFTIDATTYDIALAILLSTVRGHARILLQTVIRLARNAIHAGRKIIGRAGSHVRAHRLRRPPRGMAQSDDQDGAAAWPAPAFA